MKIGRNEKCPCGSGRKYKQCCLKLSKEAFQNTGKTAPAPLNHADDELVQYLGYDTHRDENTSPFDMPEEGLCCMVSSVNKDIQQEINAMVEYPILKLGQGQWVITANEGERMRFSGPYNSEEEAINSASEKFGAIRFISVPNFIN
tara:strand:- start:509 stop:946 length:438 start_codon:yes stop_codon:yes gene_type:complete